jgi:RNA polymerase sigma-70 factor (ECF subfamily)
MTTSPRDPSTRERLRRFERLYERHFRLIWSVVGRSGMPGTEREDIAQEVWMTVHRRLHTLRPDASPRAWLCSIARRVAFRHRRSALRSDRRLAALALEPEARGPDPDRRLAAAATVDEALAGLTEDQRHVLVLAQVHGLSAPEIAAGLGVPLNTVYSRLRSARQRIDRFAEQPELVAVLDRAERPPQEASRRVWAVLLPQLQLPASGVAVGGSFAALKSALLGMAAGAVLLGGSVVGTAEATPREAARAAETEGDRNRDQNRDRNRNRIQNQTQNRSADPDPILNPNPDPNPIPNPIPIPIPDPGASSGSTVLPGPAPTTRSAARSSPTGSPPVNTRPTPKPSPSSTPTATSNPSPGPDPAPTGDTRRDADLLAAEAELLERAHRALGDGRARAALDLLEQHRREFGQGRLADARLGAKVRALCALGRRDEAREHVRQLRREHRASSVTAAIGDGC